MMLGIASNGAFMSNVLNFIFNVAFSAVFDFILEGKLLTGPKLIGAVLMILGVIIVRGQEGDHLDAEKERVRKEIEEKTIQEVNKKEK